MAANHKDDLLNSIPMLPLDEVQPFHFLTHRYRFSLIESNADSGEMVVFIESYRWNRELNNEVSEG